MNLNTNMTIKTTWLVIALIASASVAFPASAQWVWQDKEGRKVFSDRSPPPEIADKDILTRPFGGPRKAKILDTASAPFAKSSSANQNTKSKTEPTSTPSARDTELLEKKKQAEDQAAAAKKALEEKNTKAKAENCERAKASLSTLKSGIRIATVNAKGEREYLDDSKKEQETKRAQEAVSNNCL
jgi:hypothetical protein